MCDGAFLTREYTYDAEILKEYFLENLKKYSNVEIQYGVKISAIEKLQDCYSLRMEDGQVYQTGFLLNATYASTNQILDMVGYEKFGIK